MLKIADIYEAYEAEKRKKLLLDFNDLLIETYELLKGDEDIKRKYQDAYKHILVDEFQDTNPSSNGNPEPAGQRQEWQWYQFLCDW
jgi:DNA helicase-2/ATP-dependent DNA helicase PcrA